MKAMKTLFASTGLLLLGATATCLAGGRLDTLNITTRSSIPGLTDVEVVGIFWDQRCTNVNYTLDDIPANRGTPAEIPTATLREQLQTSFNRWNDIPTSFINMSITAVKPLDNGLVHFDFVNELTFEAPPGATFLASSPSTSLQQDAEFRVGDDIDGDGDPDVFDPATAGRNTCFDVDNDGDIEFPAGLYKAGTILENDVQFNPTFVWSTVPTASTTVDIQAVATHEFGHSHGLSHSMLNQISPTDGTNSTMYPFIDIDDLNSEIGQRDLHVDDIAWSSFLYPEGTAKSGPAALQKGDRAFALEYGLIKGAVSTAGVGVLGASVKATTVNDHETLVEAFSGTAQLFRVPTGQLVVVRPGTNAVSSVVNGDYTLPVPRGLYDLSIEAQDGFPFGNGRISNVSSIGGALGQNQFPEELRSLPGIEDNIELLPGLSAPVLAFPGLPRDHVDFVTNDEIRLRNAGPADAAGTGAAIGATQVIDAERFTNAQVLALLQSGAVLTSVQFHTSVIDASVVPKYKRASLILGRVNADGTAAIDLTRPFTAQTDFVGQETDLTPLYLFPPIFDSAVLRRRLEADATLDVFVVLEANDQFETGSSGLPPLLALDVPQPPAVPTGRSFFSSNGRPLLPFFANWAIEMKFAPPRPGLTSLL
jgi:hypothetical protein